MSEVFPCSSPRASVELHARTLMFFLKHHNLIFLVLLMSLSPNLGMSHFVGHLPIARATTCRVFLQRAIQTHTLFTFFKTNDHNSSHSKIVAFGSSGSGATNVCLKGGRLAAFFQPIFD